MKLAAAAVLSSMLLSAAALAQVGDAAPPPPPPGGMGHEGPGMRHGGPMGGRLIGGHYPPMAALVAPITNAPFSAKYALDTVHQAPGPDGVVQKHSATEAVYRDSLGRTREDVPAPMRTPRPAKKGVQAAPAAAAASAAAAPRIITVIQDPVANTITRLMPDSKIAFVQTVPPDYFKHSLARETKAATGEGPRHDDRATATDLGSKTFAGVVASGRRTTFAMRGPDGDAPAPPKDGAAAPGTSNAITHERWYSPDLKLEVSSTETGGRGSRSETLTALTKGEPDAALFKIPEGYTVRNAPPHMPGGMHHGGRGPGRGDGPDGGPDAPPPPPPAM